MNPELDKILKSMQANEIFIEFAIVYKNGKGLKIRLHQVILKKDYDTVVKGLKAQYQSDEVYLMTISK